MSIFDLNSPFSPFSVGPERGPEAKSPKHAFFLFSFKRLTPGGGPDPPPRLKLIKALFSPLRSEESKRVLQTCTSKSFRFGLF